MTWRARAAAERRMILSYAPARARAGLAALLALDDTLAAILRGARDPMVGQMRLIWWHAALTALDGGAAPCEPVLQALARHVVPVVPGADLAIMIEGWEELLDPAPPDDPRLAAFAERRGVGLFSAGGRLAGAQAGDPLSAAGRGWALADLAAHVRDPQLQADARASAAPWLTAATAVRWSRSARALGAMTHLSAMPEASSPARVGRALWHRLTGR